MFTRPSSLYPAETEVCESRDREGEEPERYQQQPVLPAFLLRDFGLRLDSLRDRRNFQLDVSQQLGIEAVLDPGDLSEFRQRVPVPETSIRRLPPRQSELTDRLSRRFHLVLSPDHPLLDLLADLQRGVEGCRR